ncbi:MAG: phenylalanine--tRNA ligase subunit alpha [Pseudomonadota bacterium]|nr:phenylalanine--tRNA ligase subunit alpha [Pseudomonadota bacterium]
MEDLEKLKKDVFTTIGEAKNLDALDNIRISELGKNGRISNLLKTLGELSPDQRKERGQLLNDLKQSVIEEINTRRVVLEDSKFASQLDKEFLDVTLPEHYSQKGTIHPISQTMEEIVCIFGEMGFVVAEGPDIEEDWYNFTALNIPPNHPASQEHDTFYINATKNGQRMVLRTHTSPVQVRTMQDSKPPIRIIVPGRTYRCDHDATHSPMFHQVEGLVIDNKTHMGHLKGCLIDFLRTFFGMDDLPVRFRPSYFPFTEPSAEVDIGCSFEEGTLRIGHGEKWLEILGSGMVHPNVLENCKIDPEHYQGFAFGMGIERLAMLKYGIPDLRTFFDSDLRWLKHFGFRPLDIPSIVGRAAR